MRIFEVWRRSDVSGVSGEGHVAAVVEFDDGLTVLRWLTSRKSTTVFDSLDDAIAIHGHDGKTEFIEIAAFRDSDRRRSGIPPL